MKSTRWRVAGIVLAVLVIILITAVLLLPQLVDLNRYNGFIVSQLQSALGGEVALGRLDWGIGNGIWLEAEDLSVEGATAFPGDLALARLHARVSLLPLLAKRVTMDEILLEEPDVTIRLVESRPPVEQAEGEPTDEQPAPESGDPFTLPVEILIEQLTVQDGRIRLEDSLTLPGRQIVQEFSDVSIQGVDLAAGKELTLEIDLRNASGKGLGVLKGRVSFSGLTEAFTLKEPRLEVNASLSDFDVDMLDPYLQSVTLSERFGGRISLQVDCQGDFDGRFQATGSIDLSQVTYADPSMWEAPLPGKETTISYRASLDPEEIRIEEVQLRLGNIILSAEGLLRGWNKEPILQGAGFSLEVPLIEAVPLVPWNRVGEGKYFLRESLEEGGKITVKEALVPELPLKHLKERWSEILSKGRGSIEILDMSLKALPLLPGVEHIAAKLHLEEGVLRATDVRALIGPLTLPTLDLNVTDLTGKPKVSAVAKGPMRLVGSTDTQVKELLKEYGLERLTGDIETDIRVHYDHARPEDRDVRADLVLEGMNADFLHADVSFTDLRGRVALRRKKSVEIKVDGLQAEMNRSPIRLDGKLSGVGTERLAVDAKARMQGLDLAIASALHPPIKDLKLGGALDMNLRVRYQQADPLAIRLNGTVKARDVGFRSDARSIHVEAVNADVVLTGNKVRVERMTLAANDQKLSLSGQISNFRNPSVRLRVTSPNLDVDRLLPPAQGETAPGSGPSTEGKGEKPELPPLLRKLSAEIEAKAKEGRFRQQAFKDLKLAASYERGALKSHSLDVDIAEGHVGTRGSADLRNLERISFEVQPVVSAVPLEAIVALAGLEEVSVKGPLTIAGRLVGETGSTEDLLRSLHGDLEGRMGPGRILRVGPVGIVLFRMLDLLNVSTIFDRRSMVDLRTTGLAYDSIDAKGSLNDGILDLSEFSLKSPAMNIESIGEMDLPNQTVLANATVGVLGTVDKALGLIPIAGDVGASVTKVYLKIHGPLEDPKIEILPGKGVRRAVRGAVKAPGEAGKGVIKGMGKGLDKVLRKP